jgi:hypothetical protein
MPAKRSRADLIQELKQLFCAITALRFVGFPTA